MMPEILLPIWVRFESAELSCLNSFYFLFIKPTSLKVDFAFVPITLEEPGLEMIWVRMMLVEMSHPGYNL